MDLREKFKLAVYSASASKFEELFTKTQSYLHADFAPVKPHGNIGDRGNDGWLKNSGTYFQVYAPEELSTNSGTAQKKVKDDFNKLKQYWQSILPIRKFYFVLNDKFQGASPHISKTLLEIKEAESLEVASVYLTKNLEDDLFSLQSDQICSVLGVSPVTSQEDNKKVREFLEFYSLAFRELFPKREDAAYFFPNNVFLNYKDSLQDDWAFRRLLSKNPKVARNQKEIKDALHCMFHQLYNDVAYYNDIGNFLKFQPPHDLPDRNKIIENRIECMKRLIEQMEVAYDNIKDYAA